jgi:hypothetical protein
MSIRPVFYSLILALSLGFLINCSGGTASDDGAPVNVSDDDLPEVGNVDPTKFSVIASNAFAQSHTRTLADFSTPCEIPAGTVDQDLVCIIDMKEQDIYFQGLRLNYNAPDDMCDYLVRQTYWYYNNEIGEGPSSIVTSATFDGTDTYNPGVPAQCTVDGFGPFDCDSGVFNDLDISVDDEGKVDVSCVYDHTASDGPNCCLGKYQLTTIENHIASGGDNTSEIQKKTWGGSVAACIGGAGRTDWDLKDREGYPLAIIQSTTFSGSGDDRMPIEGLNAIYSVKPIMQTTLGSSMAIANYFDFGGSHLHSGIVDLGLTSILPYFIDPLEDRDGTDIGSGHPAYEFQCRNTAGEVRNRISVFVRDWDDKDEFDTYIASSGASGDPDTGSTGSETEDPSGIDCYGVAGFPCNDGYDLDDFLNITNGGLYDTTVPSNRSSFFPSEIYQ